MESKAEIWKPHPDIVGIEVSTLSRVRTLDRVVSSKKRTQFIKGRILKQCVNSHGYVQTSIPVDGKWITKNIHRLVAQTFIHNPDNLPMVNHKNCNRTDNRVSNLEWCTVSYNNRYREEFGEAAGHPVFAINLATFEVYQFPSQTEAGRVFGVYQQNINKVIKGKLKQTGGFWFANADDNAADAIKHKLEEV